MKKENECIFCNEEVPETKMICGWCNTQFWGIMICVIIISIVCICAAVGAGLENKYGLLG